MFIQLFYCLLHVIFTAIFLGLSVICKSTNTIVFMEFLILIIFAIQGVSVHSALHLYRDQKPLDSEDE